MTEAEAAARLAGMSHAERQELILAYAGSLYMTGMSWGAAITAAQMEANELMGSVPPA